MLLEPGDDKYPTSISPDGRFLLFSRQNPKTAFDIWVLPFDGAKPGQPRPWPQTRFTEVIPRLSPAGRLVAYMSDESGRMEVYVTPFPGPGRRWQVTSQGGTHPDWQADGRRLFYRTLNGSVEAASVAARGDELDVGPPRPLFQSGVTGRGTYIAPASDAKRILSVEATTIAATDTVTVLVNWPARRGR